MMEYEKKLLLTEEEYVTLMKYFQNGSSTKQINYYFDTDDLSMNKQGITCRIRYKNGTYKATVKKHKTDIQDCSEETVICSASELVEDVFTSMGLKLQGNLVTNRTVILKQNAYMVMLDKNDYLEHTDYELEIEYTSEKEWQAEHCLREIQKYLRTQLPQADACITYSDLDVIPNKSARFFSALQKKASILP